MLLDPETLELAPRAPEVLARLDGDPRFKLELPAAQLEIVTPPRASVRERAAAGAPRAATWSRRPTGSRSARRRRSPLRRGRGRAERGPRYDLTAREYGSIAGASWSRRSRCTWRSAGPSARLPSTTRSASTCPRWPHWRPTLRSTGRTRAWRRCGPRSASCCRAKAFPRRPVVGGVRRELAGARAPAASPTGSVVVGAPPAPAYGTLEIRVPDAQTTVADARRGGFRARSGRLARRTTRRGRRVPGADLADRGEPLVGRAPGVEGQIADLRTGERVAARERCAGCWTTSGRGASGSRAGDALAPRGSWIDRATVPPSPRGRALRRPHPRRRAGSPTPLCPPANGYPTGVAALP